MGRDATEIADPDLLESYAIASGTRLPGAWIVDKLPYVPLAFIGLGMYRAWIELVFVGSFVDFPFYAFAGHNVYDAAMIAVLFLGAAFHRRLEPLSERGWAYGAAAGLMLAGTALGWTTVFNPSLASALALPATIVGGMGTAVIILLWSELYACLSPFRVGLYYCASIVAAALVIYFCRGLQAPWLFGTCMLLPLASLFMLSIANMSLAPEERSHASDRRFSFPWKPTLLMAVYAFAFGLRESSQYSSGFGPHSAFGTLAMGVLLFLLIYRQGRSFQFATLYRVALPLMACAFLVLPAFGWFNAQVSNFCAMASYAAFSVLIMLLMASMSYRYGMSALWLFGIERGVRALATIIGRKASVGIEALIASPETASLIIGSITVAMVIVATILFASEKDLFTRWGVSLRDDGDIEEVGAQEDLMRRCATTAADHALSPREAEILAMLASGKTGPQIQDELFISKDTVKTHIKHIYRKLDVHARDELVALVEATEPKV